MATGKCFAPNMLQDYLQNPSTEKFFAVNSLENFYSKRETRLKPWNKLVIPAHFEIGKWWRKWYKLPYNMAHAEKEEMIDYAAQTNRIDAKYHHQLKSRYLGWGFLPGELPIRRLRQMLEFSYVAGNEMKKRSYFLPLMMFIEFLKQAFAQAQAQLAGK